LLLKQPRQLLPLPLTQFEYFFEHTLNVKG
jgi:hypothetical protein